jgi:hypothetical protein
LTNKAQEVRQRLFDDYEFYAKHAIHIRTKEGEISTLAFNPAQKKLHEAIEGQRKATGKVRIVILKARQQGFSTYVHGRMYWKLSQRRARKGLVVAHVSDSTKTLFDMYKRTYGATPALLKPEKQYSSRKELAFKNLDTGIMVATAGGDDIVRGETLNDVHLSEVAFWPKATAADNLNGLLKCIPNSNDTSVYVESTANGMSGVFYDLWTKAVSGENGFLPFFSAWFDTPEYRLPAPANFEPTYEELDLIKQYGLDNEQLMFRRQNIAQTNREAFQQEYPSNADEAFIASGRPVFNLEQIHKMKTEAVQPMRRMAMTLDGTTFEKDPRGELQVWYKRKSSERYYIGADVAMGIKGGDYSVAQVLDSQKRLVASWRGHIHPDAFAKVLYALGMYYFEARVAVENNNHGILTAIRLGRDLAYPNTYTEIGEGALNERDSFTIGFRTTSKSKPLIIDRLRAALREDEMEIKDPTTLQEMLQYIVTESGNMEAEEGCHDDCVMALALANHVHDGKFTPVEVTDDFYLDVNY